MLCHFWAQWLSVTHNLNLSHSHRKMLKHYLPCMPNATKSSGDWTHPGSSQLAALTLHSRKRQWIVKLTGTLFHAPTQLVGTQTPMNVLHCSNAAPLPSYQDSYKLNYGQGHIFYEILSCETNSSWYISANLTSTVMIIENLFGYAYLQVHHNSAIDVGASSLLEHLLLLWTW